MKKLLSALSVIVILIALFPSKTIAQCSATITGDSCINAIITANLSGAVPDTVKWYKNGSLLQIRVKRNPYLTEVAGSDGSLFEPRDMFVDAAGNMYIVDGVVYGVVKYAAGSSQGTIVAGGNSKGTALNQFFAPQGIAVDANGNVYVSDALMNRVTKWVPGATSGVVVAGGNGEGGAANQLSGPQNICLDAANNIYIADRWNHRIQKWAPGATTGITVAGGNGNGGAANQFSEPLDVAVDASLNVYVVDYFNSRVQKWAPGSTTGITVAGGNGNGPLANQFNFTTALSIKSDGALYIRDQGNYRIQKWVAGATQGVTVAGGNGFGGYPNQVEWGFGLFVDNQENIYVPELFLDKVDKYLPSATTDLELFANSTGKYSAQVKAENGCIAQSPLFSLNTYPPQPSTIRGPNFVSAQQQGVIYKVTKTPGLSYNWSVPADATIVAGQGTFGIKVNWGFSTGQVVVNAVNGCGQSLQRKKRVNVSEPISTQLNEKLSTKTSFSIFPNPAVNLLYLKSGNPINAIKSNITDATGKVFYCKWLGTNSLDISQLASGIYFLNLISQDKKETLKFIKE